MREAFFCRFFYLKNKRLARAKNDVIFILFILLVKKLLLRPDAIPLFRVFIRHALNDHGELQTQSPQQLDDGYAQEKKN